MHKGNGGMTDHSSNPVGREGGDALICYRLYSLQTAGECRADIFSDRLLGLTLSTCSGIPKA